MTRAAKMWQLVLEICARRNLIPPFEPEEYRDAQEKEKRCTIIMEPHLMEEGVTGMVTPDGNDMFVVLFEPRGSQDQQRKSKYHELGHIELDHVSGGQGALRKGLMTTDQELDAESFADALAVYSAIGNSEPAPKPSSGRLSRFARFLRDLRS